MSVTISLSTIDENVKDLSLITDKAKDFVNNSHWDQSIKDLFFAMITQKPNLRARLNDYFEDNKQVDEVVPLLIFLEEQHEFIIIFSDINMVPPEPGEAGSILSYIRAYGYEENILCSDCYGQLSCSSCQIEVLGGNPVNPKPRDEEYDMLDIDDEKPPTKYSRLSCQAVVGDDPLILTIRKKIIS
jgi:ferredoxin